MKSLNGMADATRSQIVLCEIEERMSELQVVMDQKLSDVKGELTTIQEAVTHISQQLVDLLGHNTGPQREGYHAPT